MAIVTLGNNGYLGTYPNDINVAGISSYTEFVGWNDQGTHTYQFEGGGFLYDVGLFLQPVAGTIGSYVDMDGSGAAYLTIDYSTAVDWTDFNLWGDSPSYLLSQADIVATGAGFDLFSAGAGDDTISGSAGGDLIYGNQGNDVLSGGLSPDTLTFYGGQGNDQANGSDGGDIIYGNYGTDSLTGGSGADVLYGGQDNDVLIGTDADSLFDGADTVFGNLGDDSIWGADFVNPGQMADHVADGGPGFDTYVIPGYSWNYGIEYLFDSVLVTRDNATDTLYNMEAIDFLDGTVVL